MSDSDSPPRRPKSAASSSKREDSESPPRRPKVDSSSLKPREESASPPRRHKTSERERSSRDRQRGRDHSRDRHRDKDRDERPRKRDDSRSRRDNSRERRRQRDSRSRSREKDNRKKHRNDSRDDSREQCRPPSRREQRDRSKDREYHKKRPKPDEDSANPLKIDRPSRFDKNRSKELPSDQIVWGQPMEPPKEEEKPKEPEYKPDFGLSGALAKDERTGNMVNGVVLKFTEPFDAALPDFRWRLYVYKGNDIVETLHIHRRSCFLLGRDTKVADIPLLNESCSGQHAVIQFREKEKLEENEVGDEEVVKFIKPYLMDLKSTHGTKLNNKRIEDSRYYELREGDLIQFGASQRDYVIMCDIAAGKIKRKASDEDEMLEQN